MSPAALVNTPIVLHNLHGPDKNVGHRHNTITAFLNAVKGGIGGFNELNAKDAAWFRDEVAERRLRFYRHGQIGAVWDPTVFALAGKPRVRKIMQGGHVGADGTRQGPDNRRVGPNRYGVYVPLTVIVVDFDFEFDVTHLMARSFTAHRWRIPLFRRSVNELADGVLSENGILVGDMNSPRALNLPGVADVAVRAPATMGRQHYDQILRWGQHIFVHGVKAVNTPSDHHMLKGLITFYRDPQDHLIAPPTTPTPNAPRPSGSLPKPGTSGVRWRRYGAPVRHPWAKKYKTKRFKRRRPRLSRRIERWKAAYRRRL